MEETRSSEKLIPMCQTTRGHIPEDRIPHCHSLREPEISDNTLHDLPKSLFSEQPSTLDRLIHKVHRDRENEPLARASDEGTLPRI